MHLERQGSIGNAMPVQLSHWPAWKQLVNLFSILYPIHQVKLLMQVKPRKSDGANICLAFDELIGIHLAKLLGFGGDFSSTKQMLKPGKRAAYLDILSTAYTMAPGSDQPTYFQLMCLKDLDLELASGPWRNNTRENCTFVLRLLAYETRTNLTENPATLANTMSWALSHDFFTKAESNDFTKKLNVRIDRGMPLEDAVSLWIEENQPASTCVIS